MVLCCFGSADTPLPPPTAVPEPAAQPQRASDGGRSTAEKYRVPDAPTVATIEKAAVNGAVKEQQQTDQPQHRPPEITDEARPTPTVPSATAVPPWFAAGGLNRGSSTASPRLPRDGSRDGASSHNSNSSLAAQQQQNAVAAPSVWTQRSADAATLLKQMSDSKLPWPEGRDTHTRNSAELATKGSICDVLRLNLGEVKLVLQKLATVNSVPSVALNESAELLCKHLSVSLCSITGYVEHCTSFVLLAAYGLGSEDLEKMPVMRGPQWSAARLLDQQTCLTFSVNSPEAAAKLPQDLMILYQNCGLRSFLSIPVSTDHEVVGALTLAKEEPDGFEVEWWEPMLGCLATGLLVYLRNEQTMHLCSLLKSLDCATDYVQLIHRLLTSAHNLLLRATNIKTGCRLALLGSKVSRAIVFEPDGKSEPTMSDSDGMGRDMGNQVHVTEIMMENTLLLDAVQKGKARFVSDCASYIQSCMKPATDIFISGHEMVASIVVLPLICDGHTFGGFYVTLETTSNFQNIKDLLMGLVNSVVLVLQKRLYPQREQIWDAIMSRSTTGLGAVAGSPAITRSSSDFAPPATIEIFEMGADSGQLSTTQSKPIVVKRSCTEAMLKVLQHELRKTHAKQQQIEWIDELVLNEIVGKGGFGVVYKGTWKGSIAAIKVMYARQHERQAMKDALEMAVLTTVSHPNIIQVYSCFTDMVEDAGGTNQPIQEGKINVRFRRLTPDEDQSLATCNILVMEYCDRASLRHAMKKGVFHKRLGSTSVAVDLCAVVQVLIEVAQAIQHLHSLKLIHCDIKPENVLLKSDGSKSIGSVTKLSDFGLAKLLRDNYYIVNRSGSGTVTHLAPELFQVGSKLTTGVDTFSFGIMMWELYTGQRAYGGLGRDAIIDRVYKKKARPVFPLGVPPMYATLAKACWDNEPALRPPFVIVLAKCNEMLLMFQNANQQSQAAASPGASASPRMPPPRTPGSSARGVPPPEAAAGQVGAGPVLALPPAPLAVAAALPAGGLAAAAQVAAAAQAAAALAVQVAAAGPGSAGGAAPAAGPSPAGAAAASGQTASAVVLEAASPNNVL